MSSLLILEAAVDKARAGCQLLDDSEPNNLLSEEDVNPIDEKIYELFEEIIQQELSEDYKITEILSEDDAPGYPVFEVYDGTLFYKLTYHGVTTNM